MGILDRIISRKESKATRALVSQDAGRPVWMPDRYANLAAEGYMANVYAKRCIDFIARSKAGLDWDVYEKQSDGTRVKLEPTPRNLNLPGVGHLLRILHVQANDLQSFAGIVEATFGFWHVGGNFFIEAVAGGAGSYNDPPVELWTHRPDLVKVIPHASERIAGYILDAPGADPVPFERWEMLHGAFWHPLNAYYGLSPIKAASMAIDSHNAATAWNVALLQNSARPSGALVADVLDDGDFERLDKELNKRYGNAGRKKNAGRPMILSGGLDWKQMSLTPAELDWLSGRKDARDEIAVGMGMSPILVGGESKAYANYKEAKTGYWEETGLALADKFRDDLNSWLTPRYGDRYVIDYDRDKIEALQENKDAVWTRTTQAFQANLIPRDVALGQLKLDPVDGADVFFADVSRMDAPITSPIVPAAKTIEPVRFEIKAFALETDEQKTNFWKSTASLRTKWAQKAEDIFGGVLEDEQRAVYDAIMSSPGIDSVAGKAAQAVSVDPWAQAYTALWLAVMGDFGDRTLGGLKSIVGDLQRKAATIGDPSDDAQDIFTDLARSYVEEIAPVKIAGLTDTSRKDIARVISAGLEAGQTIPQLASAVAASNDALSAGRSVVIARTETMGASSAGNFLMAKATGIPLDKEWIATRDTRTRRVAEGDSFDHSACDGQKRGLAEAYAVPTKSGNSEAMMFPGDPRGSAGNVIQCRCAEGYTPAGL